MRALINRLRRWCAIDAFAAIQEPGMRDEYNARAAAVSVLIAVMEKEPGRTPHDALLIIEEGLRIVDPYPPTSDAPPLYHYKENSEPPTGPIPLLNKKDNHNAVTVPARPSRISTISGMPTIPPLPPLPKKS